MICGYLAVGCWLLRFDQRPIGRTASAGASKAPPYLPITLWLPAPEVTFDTKTKLESLARHLPHRDPATLARMAG